VNPRYDFTGQVALVTGAGSGMGLATAQAFAQSGAAVVLADVNRDAVHAATDELTATGHQVLAVTCDVASEDEVAAMIDTTVATFGRLDMAFNNAGIIQSPPSDIADQPADTFDLVNAINLRGVWACMKHELRQMREQGQRRDRQQLVARRPGRAARPRRVSRLQTRRHRPDAQRRAGVCAPRHPGQRHLPRHHRDPDGHRHDRRR
jgi:NAD(P)-dependent dehydrogenase (short-subunit alcohol dehydrogenase family)